MRLRVLRELSRLSARVANRILFVSDDSAHWIGDSLGLSPWKRVVVHHGVDAARWAAAPKHPVHPWPYILSVSTIYRYKNFVKLIEAYALLAKQRRDIPDLVIVGDDQDPEYAQKMNAARAATRSLAEQIHILGEVPYTDMPSWYAGAELFVFPSHLETFGHPLLEAMASDVPVVAADVPVFHEIGGDAAFYADPHSAPALANAMHDALFVAPAREMLIKRGRERVREFSWDRSAQAADPPVQRGAREERDGEALVAHGPGAPARRPLRGAEARQRERPRSARLISAKSQARRQPSCPDSGLRRCATLSPECRAEPSPKLCFGRACCSTRLAIPPHPQSLRPACNHRPVSPSRRSSVRWHASRGATGRRARRCATGCSGASG